MTPRDQGRFMLLAFIVSLIFWSSHSYLAKLARRSVLINDSLLRLNSMRP